MEKKKFYKRKWFIAVLIVFFLIIIFSALSNDDDDLVNETSTQEDQPEQEEIIVISVDKLIKVFDDNEVKANNEFKGKKIEVTGIVYDIGEILNSTYVILSTNEDFSVSNVQCYFKDENEISKIAEINKGDELTFIGKCDGKIINIEVKDCIFK